jgi:hypothetical protein
MVLVRIILWETYKLSLLSAYTFKRLYTRWLDWIPSWWTLRFECMPICLDCHMLSCSSFDLMHFIVLSYELITCAKKYFILFLRVPIDWNVGIGKNTKYVSFVCKLSGFDKCCPIHFTVRTVPFCLPIKIVHSTMHISQPLFLSHISIRR